MKLKYTFAINEVAGQLVAVPIDCQYGEQSIIKTNETGAYILNLLKNEISFEDIIANINQNYEITNQSELENWLKEFIKTLKNADVLTDE